MKIIKEGRLPVTLTTVVRGTCNNCGCVVEDEKDTKLVRGFSVVSCPTYGCGLTILLLPYNDKPYL